MEVSGVRIQKCKAKAVTLKSTRLDYLHSKLTQIDRIPFLIFLTLDTRHLKANAASYPYIR